MAKIIKPLSNFEIESAKPKDKEYKLMDGGGLFLMVSCDGKKRWRFRYNRPITKKEADITIGEYPYISLSDARETREHYRKTARSKYRS